MRKYPPPYIPGTPVCFASCWSGSSGTAQQLANELNVPVYAPTRPVAWDIKNEQWIQQSNASYIRNGQFVEPYMPSISPEWKMFYPKNK